MTALVKCFLRRQYRARQQETLTAANDRLQRDRAGLTVERDALTVARDELLARVSDLEQMVAAGETASSAALDVLASVAPTSSKRNGTLTTIDVHCTP
jgi:hypothetical protein